MRAMKEGPLQHRRPTSKSIRALVLALPLALTLALLPFSPQAARAEQPELIPLDVLFGNPSHSRARVSPDGTMLSCIAPSEAGVLNVWVRTIGQDDDTMVTNDTHRGIRIQFWAENSRHLIYLQDSGGDENWHVYASDLQTKVVRDLTPFQGIRATNVITDRNHPDEILVGLNLRDRRMFDMYRIDLVTGAVVLDTENPGDVLGWLTDPDFQIGGAMAQSNADGSQTLRVRDGAGKPWRDLVTWPFGENGGAIDFAADGRSLYATSTLGSDKARLVRIDFMTGQELEVIAQNKRVDVGAVEIHPDTRIVQAVEFDYLKPEWLVIDPGIKKDMDFLKAAHPGAYGVISRDHADRIWIVYYAVDDGPLTYYVYDRAGKTLDFLFADRPELQKYQLAKCKPVVIKARDGLELVSYLTVPVSTEPKKLPLVLLPHGGPWARDYWGYDPMVQWCANRGYATLTVNFRGSAGFGKSFLNAGNLEWGVGAMQHDLTDAVRWAIKEGIADPDRVAIMGSSYGGYATLAGVTFTPELYACGVDIVGPSNIKTLMEAIPPYWEQFKKEFQLRVGDPENDQEFNRKISPLFHVDKIKAPLMIGQGANDPRVNIREADQIVEAMRKKNLPVTYVVYTDEGHGFARPQNRLDFYGRVDGFLAEHLGGRHQPFVEVDGTSAEVR
jgi:dipeptidyl aminopeptidase/acylaminoacyl peptidase